MVKAKFKVHEVRPEHGGDGGAVTLFPVVDGSPENKDFYKWTPGGKIELSTINANAFKEFQPGDEFYVLFEKAPKGS
jgi:hypothetical protein